MGHGPERHDLMSQETHAGRWIGYRQPVTRVAREADGERFTWTHEANPGEVWEEDEFWIALSWAIDPDGALGIRKHFESPYRPGECTTIAEHYRWIFENSVPGLPEAAARQNTTPLEYMQRHGCFEVQADVQRTHESEVDVQGASLDAARGVWVRDGAAIAVQQGGRACAGFETPSRKLEFYSPTMREWGYQDHALPGYIPSHIHESQLDRARGETVLVPTFRLPTLIHTRSGNAKWLYEISNSNPVWIHPRDAAALELATGDLVRVTTRIGYFVNKAWVTEGIRPGVVACSHHLGRWRREGMPGTDRWAAPPVDVEQAAGMVHVRRTGDIAPFSSSDPDSKRVWWSEGGVHQNLTFPVQPDPVSGMHCWHQKVTVTKAFEGDRYGDVHVDTTASMEVYREWLAKAPVRRGPGGLRRPLWFARAFRPSAKAYQLP
jgi:anaerobic selenocysteine-containing dehydrogenase